MDVGFTGTQDGLTQKQITTLRIVFRTLRSAGFTTLHNGDCIGADKTAYEEWKALDGKVVGHPPDVDSKRAFSVFDVAYTPAAYLQRNKHIVQSSRLLIATPNTMQRKIRSGTWSTVRFAEKTNVPVTIIYPDGSLEKVVDV